MKEQEEGNYKGECERCSRKLGNDNECIKHGWNTSKPVLEEWKVNLRRLVARVTTRPHYQGDFVSSLQLDVEDFLSQEKAKSFKAGLERAVDYIQETSTDFGSLESGKANGVLMTDLETLQEARELKEGE